LGASPEVVEKCGGGSEGRLNLTAIVDSARTSYGDFVSMLGDGNN
jgi:hypothetical protein